MVLYSKVKINGWLYTCVPLSNAVCVVTNPQVLESTIFAPESNKLTGHV